MGGNQKKARSDEWHFGKTKEVFWAIEDEGIAPLADALRNGFDPEKHHYHGSTIVHAVAEQNDPQLLRQLLELYPNIDLPTHDSDRRTALHQAIRRDAFDTVKMLIQHGASLEVRDRLGYNAAHLLVISDSIPKITKLVLAYATPAILTAEDALDGETPMSWAIKRFPLPKAQKFIDRYIELGCPLSMKHGGEYLWRWCKYECWLDLAVELKSATEAEINLSKE